MPRRVLAILNPISGRRGMAVVVREVGCKLEQAGAELVIRETEGPGHATELAQAAAGEVDAVLVVGGDGTVSEVVNGFAAPTPPGGGAGQRDGEPDRQGIPDAAHGRPGGSRPAAR